MADFAVSDHHGVQEQLARLGKLALAGDTLGLERIRALLDRLGSPHRALPPVFHVAGTNGKGSTCAFLRAAIESSGRTVHVFTSPHLVRFNERFRIAGRLIDDATLADLLREVLDRGGEVGATFFEIATAIAFLAFARCPADACILEVGLGGRLDATNIVENPVATGIAQIGVDHEAFLGNSRAAIAGEKAAIAKAGVPLSIMRYPEDARMPVLERANAAGARVLEEGDEWTLHPGDGDVIYEDRAGRIRLPLPILPGAHQLGNLGLATSMLRSQRAIGIDEEALQAAAGAPWPARLQRLGDGDLTRLVPAGSPVWIDGAHNEAAGSAAARALAGLTDRPVHLVAGILSVKDAQGLIAPFASNAASFQAVPVPGHDCHEPSFLTEVARGLGIVRCSAAANVAQALTRITQWEGRPSVLIFGSLYLAGAVLAANGDSLS